MRYFCTHCAEFVSEYVPESIGWNPQPGRSEGVLNVSCKMCRDPDFASRNSADESIPSETTPPSDEDKARDEFWRERDRQREHEHQQRIAAIDADAARSAEASRIANEAERAQQARFGKVIALVGTLATILAAIYSMRGAL